MHILYITSWYPLNEKDINGSFFREQAHALSNMGHKVGVIAPQFRSLRLGKRAIIARYDIEVWQDGDVPTYMKHGVFWFPRVPYLDLHRWTAAGNELLEDYIKQHGKPDLIHVQSMTMAGPVALNAHEKYNIPYCVMEHSSTYARGLVKDWQTNYLNAVTNNSCHNMAVSHDLAELLTAKFPGSNWTYFPNLLDKMFEQQSDKPVDNQQFCVVARLHPVKALDNLLQAFAKVLEKHPTYRLTLAGDGPEKANLQQLSQQLNISHAVTFLGPINRQQVKDLMAGSFCFVLSSQVETFGVVVIEALSQGTPVIATKCGGPESILTPVDGILVENHDINALANAMVDMIESPQLYNRAEIRQHCLDRFSERVFIDNMLEIYSTCIKGAQRA